MCNNYVLSSIWLTATICKQIISAHTERYHPDGKTKDGDPPSDREQRKHLQSTSTTEDRPDQLESHWQDLEETGDEGRQKLALGRAKQRRRSDFP